MYGILSREDGRKEAEANYVSDNLSMNWTVSVKANLAELEMLSFIAIRHATGRSSTKVNYRHYRNAAFQFLINVVMVA